MSRRILLGVTGGIAAYKAAALVSTLVQRGDDVTVILSDGAREFVGVATFAALTRKRVHCSLWDEPEKIPHISLVREADVLAIVPATANVIAKLARGIADDLLSDAALAARIPILIAPAMNDAMFEHPATRENLATLEARGVTIVEPGTGFLAEREFGVGRLAEQEDILAALDGIFERGMDLQGERVLITAGPTREAIDPVRFLSNAASGSTGIELAREALARGAEVELVLGPTWLQAPQAVHVAHVVSAQEMYDATLARAGSADFAIASAAVADWRPVSALAEKAKKFDGPSALELERTPDILAALRDGMHGGFLLGFAAETENHEHNAREKLRAKRLDAIVVNDVAGGAGFGEGENELVLLWGEAEREPLGRASKRRLARRLWDAMLHLRARD